MSESKVDLGDEMKSSRKHKKTQISRQFLCGCGKSYMSYSALYTHIKNKHNGVQPEQTQRVIVVPYHRIDLFPKLDAQLLKKAESYVTTETLLIIKELGESGRGIMNVDNRIIKTLIGKQIWTFFCAFCQNPPQNIHLTKASSFDEVIIVYLLGIGQYISFSLIKHYNIFARLFRNCFYHHAPQIYVSCFKDRQQTSIDISDCRFAPIISDFFIRFYLPYQIQDKDQINLYELMTDDFCRWMRLKKLTKIQIKLNQNYELRNTNFFAINGGQKKTERKKASLVKSENPLKTNLKKQKKSHKAEKDENFVIKQNPSKSKKSIGYEKKLRKNAIGNQGGQGKSNQKIKKVEKMDEQSFPPNTGSGSGKFQTEQNGVKLQRQAYFENNKGNSEVVDSRFQPECMQEDIQQMQRNGFLDDLINP